MLTVFNLKKGREFYASEMAAMTAEIAKYAETPSGQWLASMNWQRFEYRWADAMRDSDILGAYSCFSKNRIYVCPPHTPDIVFNEKQVAALYTYHASQSLIVQTIIHELRHAYQHRKLRALYYIASIVGIREFLIERDARRIENEAAQIIKSRTPQP